MDLNIKRASPRPRSSFPAPINQYQSLTLLFPFGRAETDVGGLQSPNSVSSTQAQSRAITTVVQALPIFG
ncbi:MAG: hypothetical protein ACREBC_11080, partial [Pyrinomonadaceae bacterium]